jgi:hypothetical protein
MNVFPAQIDGRASEYSGYETEGPAGHDGDWTQQQNGLDEIEWIRERMIPQPTEKGDGKSGGYGGE